MNPDFIQMPNQKKWNRRIISVYWFALFTYVMATSIDISFFDPRGFSELIGRIVIFPSLLIFIVILILELAFLYFQRYFHYISIVGGNIISAIVISALYDTPIAMSVLMLPIFISVVYFTRNLINFAFIVSVITFWSLYSLDSRVNETYTISDTITILAILLVSTVIKNMIMSRGNELLEDLKTTIESQQDLMVKNILMEKLSKTDALTDIYNHMAFHEYLESIIKQCKTSQLSLHIAVIDIDNFKGVNDTFGHRSGDMILYRVAQKIKQGITSDDFVCRYGGEEFVVILTNKSLEETVELIEKIRLLIAEDKHEELIGQAVTVSIGIHSLMENEGKEELFEGADSALYVAKRSGKNRTMVYKANPSDIENEKISEKKIESQV